MKIKLTSILASCLLTLCVSLPAFAMLGEEESDHAAITAVQDRFTNYQKRMHTLEEEKASLQGVKSKLENNLRETDEILGYVLEEATPTIIQYLRAISKGSSSEDEVKALKDKASTDTTLPDLIIRSSKQIRESTPASIRALLALHGDTVRIGDSFPTINYANVTIPSTPTKKMDVLEQATKKSTERRKSDQGSDQTEEVTQKLEQISVKEEEEPENNFVEVDAVSSILGDLMHHYNRH